MDVLYFAWVRERIGLPRERIETEAATVRDLVAELAAREERYAVAFADTSALRVAVDQDLTDFDAPLAGAREVAVLAAAVPLGQPTTGGCPEYACAERHTLPRACASEQDAVVVAVGAVHVDFHAAFDFADDRFGPSHCSLLQKIQF